MQKQLTWLVFVSALSFWSSRATKADVVLVDDFTSFDNSKWSTAPYLSGLNGAAYDGLPQSLTPTTLDGKSVLRMTSIMNNNRARGFGSIDTYSFATGTIELDFKTMPLVDNTVPAANQRNIDRIMELFLVNPVDQRFMEIGITGGDYGANRIAFTNSSLASPVDSAAGIWSYESYYRLVIVADLGTTRLSFRSDTDVEIFGHTYNFDLGALGDFKIVLAQRMQLPGAEYYSDAAVDRLVVTSAVPESSTLPLFLMATVALVGVRVWRKRRLRANSAVIA